jgi:hypothetical protein
MERGKLITMARLLAGRPVLDSQQEFDIFSSSSRPGRLLGLTHLMLTGNQVLFMGVKRAECETNPSSPSSAKVKNAWGYTSTSRYVFMG